MIKIFKTKTALETTSRPSLSYLTIDYSSEFFELSQNKGNESTKHNKAHQIVFPNLNQTGRSKSSKREKRGSKSKMFKNRIFSL